MNVREIESSIIVAYSQRDWEYINQAYNDLSAKLFKLDKWFNKFLDIFSDKMDDLDSNDPVHKLYKLKHNEYGDISKLLKITRRYMEMNHV